MEIENTGGLPLPVHLTLTEADGTEKEITRACTCWKDSKKRIVLELRVEGLPSFVRLGNDGIPDMLPADNRWKP